MNTPSEVMLPDGSSFVLHADGNTSHWTYVACDLCDLVMTMESRYVLRADAWEQARAIDAAKVIAQPWLCEECASAHSHVMVHVLDAPYTWSLA